MQNERNNSLERNTVPILSFADEKSSIPDPITDGNWSDYANCKGTELDIWFPSRGEDVRPAKRICAGCIVRSECLEENLANKYGIVGGMSERDRRAERRRRRNG